MTIFNRQGIMLLMALLVFILITFIVFVLISLTRLEEGAAENTVLDTKAKFLAFSGVSESATIIKNWYRGIQPGKKRHVMGEEPFSPQTTEEHLLLPWAYVNPQYLENFNPSKELENNIDISLKKYEIEIEEVGKVGLSGIVNASEENIEGFSLKIVDSPSQIFINGKEGTPLPPNTIKMLNSLGEILAENYNFTITNLGEKINDFRKHLGRNIISKDELLPILGTTQAERRKNLSILKGYISIYAKLQEKVVNPGEFIWDKGTFNLRVKSNDVILKRAPININTASFEILYSVFNGLRGFQWNSEKMNFYEVSIDSSLAKKIAHDLIKFRTDKVKKTATGITILDEFEKFLNSLDYLSYGQKKLILANANPNSQLNTYNPNKVTRNIFGDVDKSKLVYSDNPSRCGFTTEFIFDSNGLYEVTSLGRILKIVDKRGDVLKTKIIAQKLIDYIIDIYEVKTITTQNDFQKAIVKSNNIEIYPDVNNFSEIDGYIGMKLFEWEPIEKSFKFYQKKKDADFSLSDISNLGTLPEKPLRSSSINTDGFKEWVTDGILLRKKRYNSFKFTTPVDYDVRFNMDKSIDLQEGALAFWLKPSWRSEELTNSPKIILTINRKGIPYFLIFAIKEDDKIKLIFVNFQIVLKNKLESERLGTLFKISSECESLYKSIESRIKEEKVSLEMKRNYTGIWEYDISNWKPGEWHHIAAGWAPDKITNISLLPNVPFEGVVHCPENLVYWEDFQSNIEQSEIPVMTFFVDGSSAKVSSVSAGPIRLTIFSNTIMPFLQKIEDDSKEGEFDFMPMFAKDNDIYLESGITLKDIVFTKRFDSLFLRPQKDNRLEQEVIECVKKMKEKLPELRDMTERIKEIAEKLRSMGGSQSSLFDLATQYQAAYFGGQNPEIAKLMQEAVDLSIKILESLNSLCPKEILDNIEQLRREMEQSSVGNAKLLAPMIRYQAEGDVTLYFTFNEYVKPISLEWSHYIPNYWQECVYYGNEEKLGCFKGPSFIGIRDRMHTGGMEFLPKAGILKPNDKFYVKITFSTNQRQKILEAPFLDDLKIKALYTTIPYKIIQSSDIRKF